jgi:hypothetical protein
MKLQLFDDAKVGVKKEEGNHMNMWRFAVVAPSFIKVRLSLRACSGFSHRI